MHEIAFPLLVGLIALALAFDFLNGLHDAANSIATVVSTRLLSPVQAVLFAAVGNFVAYWMVGLHVAETVGKGIIDKDVVTPAVVFGALIGAMFWNVLTWVKGIPSSSSHALIGGLLGAGIMHGGFGAVESSGTSKTIVAIFLSPMIGFALAMLMVLITSWLFRGYQPRRAERVFKSLHLVSSAAYSISHGGNDAQKTMGIIAVLLYSTGTLKGEFHVPEWVVIACYAAISLGTLSGGWKIIQTMGSKLTQLNHHTGFCASTAGSIVVFGASAMGIPVSTTHAITGSVVGTGAARRASAVRWGVATRVVVAWFITIPASAAVGAAFYLLTRLF
ncbi:MULTISPECIES: inorganic phosphate transporter [unclassified Novosphingobium]|jgi:PiT family inorganic phosphate transporter|uniref:inorganic phosphate transporter n=1 Tax=unclassified Novosphingobium TaxID=2644732 RepID=UPI00061C75F7|nr:MULTISPECIES: inorganic phosphate transporter [unclassified Novosphingobium]MBF5090616.1 inorganic phosphate transporter [Novosphingobium sp. NBM11]RQW43453.1 inorganic phosphate transporter [Novosphingobium sp. LASN5T]GAO54605.1 low-affinity inorganic phosphate transporter [Novosphingobium sp. MD-1]